MLLSAVLANGARLHAPPAPGPNETAAVASPVKVACAILAGTTSLKLPGAFNLKEEAPEMCVLKAAFTARGGDVIQAARDLAQMYAHFAANSQWTWARRASIASALVLARDGDRATALLYCSRNASSFAGEELLACLVFSCRLRAEMGQLHRAELDWSLASALAAKLDYPGKDQDARLLLAKARICFAQRKFDEAVSVYQQVLAHPGLSLDKESPPPGESEEAYICSLALSSVVGYTGDYVRLGSRLARLEAANNIAVCSLQLGQLDQAVQALENMCKGDREQVDGIVASNLRTLYDLARTPDNARLPLLPATLVKLG